MRNTLPPLASNDLLCPPGLVSALSWDAAVVIGKFASRDFVFVLTDGAVTPNVKRITNRGLRLDMLHEHIKVVENEPVGRSRAAVEPMLNDNRSFIFERLLNNGKVLGRKNLSSVGRPIIRFSTNLHRMQIERDITVELTRRRDFKAPSAGPSKLREALPPLASNDLLGDAVGLRHQTETA